MNKFKLVPVLTMTKKEAKIQEIDDAIETLLNDNTIDTETKMDFWQKLLLQIRSFRKEPTRKKTDATLETSAVVLPDKKQPKTKPKQQHVENVKPVITTDLNANETTEKPEKRKPRTATPRPEMRKQTVLRTEMRKQDRASHRRTVQSGNGVIRKTRWFL